MAQQAKPYDQVVDEGQAYAIRLTNKIFTIGLVAGLFFVGLYAIGHFGFSTQNALFSVNNLYMSMWFSLAMASVFFVSKLLMRFNMPKASITVAVLGLLTIAMVSIIALQTSVYDPVMHLFYLCLVVASVFLDRKILFLIAAFGTAFNVLFFFLSINRIVQTTHKPLTLDDVIVDSILLWLMAMLLMITLNQLNSNRKDLLRYQTELEDIVNERTAQYHAERDRAEEANLAKSQFLANMSHELRTPLNAIIGYAELIEETIEEMDLASVRGEVSPDVGRIEVAGRHLLELINNILDLSKIDAGKMELNLAYHSLFSIIDDVFNSLVPQVEAKNLSFKVNIVDQAFVDELIYVDKLKVQQILMNLLSNAVKFTDYGRIDLTVEELGTRDDLAVVFKVRDTGVGIAEEFFPYLFQRFNQEDGSPTRKHDGSGLGLAISKQLVEMMGGEISVESEREIGSEFKVILPTSTVPAYSQKFYSAEVKAKREI